MSALPVYLGILWGHLPRGIIRTTRNICRRDESPVPFCLARRDNTGKRARTVFNTLGNIHLDSPQGPFPVSLVEMASEDNSFIPRDVILKLHAISIGFPIVGETEYVAVEKFFNPVVKPPDTRTELLLAEWINSEGTVKGNDANNVYQHLISLSAREIEHGSVLRNHSKSIFTEFTFDGESSNCNYINHPESLSIRNDRGKIRNMR